MSKITAKKPLRVLRSFGGMRWPWVMGKHARIAWFYFVVQNVPLVGLFRNMTRSANESLLGCGGEYLQARLVLHSVDVEHVLFLPFLPQPFAYLKSAVASFFSCRHLLLAKPTSVLSVFLCQPRLGPLLYIF